MATLKGNALSGTIASFADGSAAILIGGTALMPPSTAIEQFYKMTGFLTGVAESWTAGGAPNTSPPNGHILNNITYVRIKLALTV